MSIIKDFGLIAGLAGIALGVFLFLFREVIRKNIFQSLSRTQSFSIILVFMIMVWTLSLVSIYLYYQQPDDNRNEKNCSTWLYNKSLIDKTKSHQLGTGGRTYVNRNRLRGIINDLDFELDEKLDRDRSQLLWIIDNSPSYNDVNYNMLFTNEAKELRDKIERKIIKYLSECE